MSSEDFPPWPGTQPKLSEEENHIEEEYVINAAENGQCKVIYDKAKEACTHEGHYSFDQAKALVHRAYSKGRKEVEDEQKSQQLNNSLTLLVMAVGGILAGFLATLALVRMGVVR